MKRCRAPACGKVIEAEAAVTAGFPGERWTSKQSWRGDDCGFPGERWTSDPSKACVWRGGDREFIDIGAK